MKTLIGVLTFIAISFGTAWSQTPPGAEARLKEKNIQLPSPPAPVANYVGAVRTGNLLFLAGTGPGPEWVGKGKVGKDEGIRPRAAPECICSPRRGRPLAASTRSSVLSKY